MTNRLDERERHMDRSKLFDQALSVDKKKNGQGYCMQTRLGDKDQTKGDTAAQHVDGRQAIASEIKP